MMPQSCPIEQRTERCRVPGCGRPIHPKLLTCPECWRKLPKGVRDKLWEAHKGYVSGKYDLTECRRLGAAVLAEHAGTNPC